MVHSWPSMSGRESLSTMGSVQCRSLRLPISNPDISNPSFVVSCPGVVKLHQHWGCDWVHHPPGPMTTLLCVYQRFLLADVCTMISPSWLLKGSDSQRLCWTACISTVNMWQASTRPLFVAENYWEKNINTIKSCSTSRQRLYLALKTNWSDLRLNQIMRINQSHCHWRLWANSPSGLYSPQGHPELQWQSKWFGAVLAGVIDKKQSRAWICCEPVSRYDFVSWRYTLFRYLRYCRVYLWCGAC